MAIDLDYTETGDGAPLMIIHGLFGWKRNWSSIGKRLGKNARVYTLDMRNHGLSPWHDDMTYDDMADDLKQFIDHHNLHKPILLGHSMGGKAAMTLALRKPEFLGGLLIADIAPVTYTHDYDDHIQIMQDIDLNTITSRQQVDEILSRSFEDLGLRAFLLQNLDRNETGFRWRINLRSIKNHMDDILGFPKLDKNDKYDGPTLFLKGGMSDYINNDNKQTIKNLFPKAAIETINNAGHWVHAEQPEAVIGHVQSFLESNTSH